MGMDRDYRPMFYANDSNHKGLVAKLGRLLWAFIWNVDKLLWRYGFVNNTKAKNARTVWIVIGKERRAVEITPVEFPSHNAISIYFENGLLSI